MTSGKGSAFPRRWRLPAARKAVAGLAIGAVATVAAFVLGRVPLVGSFENKTHDAAVAASASPAAPTLPIVIVEINDSTVQKLEPVVGRWPWPRLVEASALDYIAGAGAKTVAFDILFGEREGRTEATVNGNRYTGAESDQAFVDAVKRAGNVVLLADATSEGMAAGGATVPAPAVPLPGVTFAPGPGFQTRPTLQLPFDDLATAAAGIGHNVLPKDPGSDAARRVFPFIDYNGRAVPSLGVAAALAFTNARSDEVALSGSQLRMGAATAPILSEPMPSTGNDVVPSHQQLIRFSSPTTDRNGVRSMFPTYSFYDVLVSEDSVSSKSGTPPIPASAFAGKLVFIGTTAAGLYDRYATPFPGGAAGVELHAMVASNILSNSFMRRTAPLTDFAMDLARRTGRGVRGHVAAGCGGRRQRARVRRRRLVLACP